MDKDVIIALDFSGADEVFSFLDLFGEKKPFVKIGMELFYSTGADMVRELKARGHKVFLDLKLHDIPNTVKKAMAAVSVLGADMVNVHAAGGSEMMKAAVQGATRADGTRPIIIAVTQLTSISDRQLRDELCIELSMQETVSKYAANAMAAGLDGVVCSPLEAAGVKERCSSEFLTVTPGIRFLTDSVGDQARVTDPARAKGLGCDYIVVGRSITGSADPVASYERCVNEFIG